MSLTIRKMSAAVVAAGLATSIAACGDPVEPLGDGSLALSWQVSPRGCKAAGVDSVDVRLDNAHRSRSQSFACADGEATVDDIAPANYELTVVGLDAAGNETFISKPRVVTIGAEKLNETALVRLTAKPGTIEVGWRFENGRVCGANGVSSVEVAVYDTADYEIARKEFTCDRGLGVVEGLAAGGFIVEAIAEGSDAVFHGTAETTLKRGDHALVDVELGEQ